MNQAFAIAPATETKWTVVSGPMKGAVRLMNRPQFSIGRSSDCEFVIVNDPKCSRRHATIICGPEGCEVITITEDNPVLLNGREIERAVLKDNDIITVGETEIQYNCTNLPQNRVIQRVLHQVPGHAPVKGKVTRQKSSPMKKIMIYGVVGLILFWLLSPSGKKKKEIDIRTEQQIQADIEAANKLKEVADGMAVKQIDQSMTHMQAQENYVRGFRDYRKGQFERSLVSFQACLALNPQHVLCNRYIRLAQRRFHELIQYEMVLGKKYRDQNQFKACRAAYRNVMVMVKDTNNPTFKEAKANYEACNSFVEGRY